MKKRAILFIHSKFINMIFKGEKNLEFIDEINSNIKPETKVFFCENKKVIGEAIIIHVQKLDPFKRDLYKLCWNDIGYTNQRYAFSFSKIKKYCDPIDIDSFEY